MSHPWPSPGDDAAWRNAYAHVRRTMKQVDADRVIKKMRAQRYHMLLEARAEAARAKRVAELPAGVKQWIDERIKAMAKDCSCVDNVRWANAGISSQWRRYFRQRAHGCCGYHDVKMRCFIDGQVYLLGFNHGH